MPISIELSPELEKRLRQIAQENGLGLEEWTTRFLEREAGIALPENDASCTVSTQDDINWRIEERLGEDGQKKTLWSTPLKWPVELQIGASSFWRSAFCRRIAASGFKWFLKREMKPPKGELDMAEAEWMDAVIAAGQKQMQPIPLRHPQLSKWCITDSATSPAVVREIFDEEVEEAICALLNQIPVRERKNFRCGFDKTNLKIETPILRTDEQISALVVLGEKIAGRARCFEGKEDTIINIEPFVEAAKNLPPDMRSEFLKDAPLEIQSCLRQQL